MYSRQTSTNDKGSLYSRKSLKTQQRNVHSQLKSSEMRSTRSTENSIFKEPVFMKKRSEAQKNFMANFQRNPLGSPRRINNAEIYEQRITKEYPDYQKDEQEFKKFRESFKELLGKPASRQFASETSSTTDLGRKDASRGKLPNNLKFRSQLLQRLLTKNIDENELLWRSNTISRQKLFELDR